MGVVIPGEEWSDPATPLRAVLVWNGLALLWTEKNGSAKMCGAAKGSVKCGVKRSLRRTGVFPGRARVSREIRNIT